MGLESLLLQNMQNAGLTGIDRLAGNAMFPQSQMDKTQYAIPSQLPTSAETIRSDYDSKTDPYTGLPSTSFKKGGLAAIGFYEGGSPEEKRAAIADIYKKVLGRDPGEGEDIMQWADQFGEGTHNDILSFANRLAQTEEGTAYGKSKPNDVFANMVELTQKNSPFAGTDNPYANMKYLTSSTNPVAGDETGATTTSHLFQDQNGGVMTVDANGQPIGYEPGRGWYDEQLRANPDAVRGSSYRNQQYLATGPLDKTYKFNGVDVPINAQEFQLDPKTGQFITGKSGDYAPVLMRDKGYSWFDDWGAPAMVVAIPALAAAGVYAAGAYGAGAGAGALGAEGAATVGGGALGAEGAGAIGAGGAAAGGGGGAAAGGAGGAAAGGGGSTALNTVRGALLANSLINQLGGGSRQGYSGQGLNPYGGNVGFNPGVRVVSGLPGASGYEKTPWANMMPQISLSKLSEFSPTREMSGGGTAESDTEEQILRRIRNNIKGSSESNIPRMVDDLLESQRRAELLDKINAKFDVPSAQYVEGLGLMTPPPSVNGRLGVNSNALGGNIRAGLSGNVMMTPDKKILANPGMMDIGYRSSKESEYDPTFDISLQRALKSMPGRSRDYAVAANYTVPFAQGGDVGHLGGYSDGGRLLKGPGDGMSDNIPASIANKQPARLADGEFVIPADVVSHLGNGSTDAGAKQLYAMMDKVRKARTGNKKQGKQIKPSKFLPKG